jgi:adenosylcobinamide-GDP ribazoletransferase
MPQTEWDKNSMKYALCFFPFVGVVIGAFMYFWSLFCVSLGFNLFLFSAVMVVLPILISGGIHLDGFIDTSDAIYSRRDKEKKLEILKDPHVGAFGVIMCATYLILQFGFWGQFFENQKFIFIIMLGFALSRSLSALSVVTFKTSSNSGLAYLFSDSADKKTVKIVVSLYILILFVFMLYIGVFIGVITIIASLVWFFVYKRICYNGFGGISGDLAGYFLQILELVILIIATIGGILC